MKNLTLLLCLATITLSGYPQFAEQQVYGSGISRSDKIQVADLDGDGLTDALIGTTGYTNKIAWLKHSVSENMGLSKLITTIPYGFYEMHTADLDSDGDTDFLIASSGDDSISWYENDGNGNFGPQQAIHGTAVDARGVFTGDLDNDGDIDVLSAYNNHIAWYENNGSEDFTAHWLTWELETAWAVFCADLDGDGDLDALSASRDDNKVGMYENLGNGEFADFSYVGIGATRPIDVYAHDIDNDGDIDVISTESGPSYNSYYKIKTSENDGVGNFSNTTTVMSQPSSSIESTGTVDIELDGDQDFLCIVGNSLAIIENIGDSVYSTPVILPNEGANYKSVEFADIDYDGDIDLMVGRDSGGVIWYENDGLGGFDSWQEYHFLSINSFKTISFDVDNDDDMDVVVYSPNYDRIMWFENNGLGEIIKEYSIVTGIDGLKGLISSDINGDGILDILTTTTTDDQIIWFENDGSGNFGEANMYPISDNTTSSIISMDYDDDGDKDMIIGGLGKIFLYENDGLGSYGNELIINLSIGNSIQVLVKDFNSDGYMDFVVWSVSDKVVWIKNNGDGTFDDEQLILDEIVDLTDVNIADVDGDGDVDVLTVSGIYYSTKDFSWFRNEGNGNFGDQIIIDNNDFSNVEAIDIDGDNDLDLFSHSPGSYIIIENIGSGNFDMPQTFELEPSTGSTACFSDMDGDGDIDIVTSSSLIGISMNLYGNGCTDIGACNYNSFYNYDDGSCCYSDCGCTDSSADNYNSTATCDDSSCIYLGCTNMNACNFDYTANTDDGSCILPDGCTDPESNNYNPNSECDDGSCTYRLDGLVFFDENENGIMDASEYGLPFQEVILEPVGLMGITNDDGNFFFSGPGLGDFMLTLNPSETFPFVTTTNPISFEIEFGGANQELLFGVSNEEANHAICVDFYPDGNGYPCNDFINHNICYRNMGTVPIDGIVEVEYDALFQGYQEVTPIDSVLGNHIYMSFENLLPGQMFFYDVLLHTPTVDFIGDWLTSTARVYGVYEDNDVAYGDQELVQEMTCSYDPNDKQVFPAGYEEPHYVLNDTELEYLVRFQNTGNAAAINVTVSDTIDENLDLNTFMLMANSHSVMTSINSETRVVDFFFENIMLPDSTTDEAGSHGLISYTIRPYLDLDIETEINNTGYIYFDNNPAIVTNTTWSTIYVCKNQLAAIDAETTTACVGSEFTLTSSQDYVENYLWSIDGDSITIDSSLTNLFEVAGEYLVKLNVNNPLCQALDSVIVSVNPSPEVQAGEDQTICFGDNAILLGNWGENFEWLGLGTDSTYHVIPEENSIYTLYAVNDFECESSDDITIIVNPLPEADAGDNVEFCNGGSTILTASGGGDYDWNGLGTDSTLSVNPSQTTVYELVVSNEYDCIDTDSVIVTVFPLPEANAGEDIHVCIGDTAVLTATGGILYDWAELSNGSILVVVPDETTTYDVTVWNEYDCVSTDDVIVHIEQYPDPIITQFDTYLTSSEGASYQWFLNDEPITGATTQNYTFFVEGSYSVEVTNEYGCSSISDAVIITSISESVLSTINLYPNPMADVSYLFFEEDCNTCKIKLHSSNGQLIREYDSISGNKLTIHRKGLAAGTYVLQVNSLEERIREFILVVE